MKFHSILIALGGFTALSPLATQAALIVTNGGFGTTNQNARVVDGGGWFESTTTTNWQEGSWANPGAYPDAFPGGTGMVVLYDGAAANGYIYQSLGTIDLTEIAAGTMRVISDFAEKSDDTTVDGTFDVYVGSWGAAAHGTDIAGAGLTNSFSMTMTAADQGLTAASGNQSRAVGVMVGDMDVSGLSEGDELWLRIGRPSGGAGDFMIDNVALEVVPEPSVALLGTLGVLGLLRRRRV